MLLPDPPSTHNYMEWVYYYSDGSNNFVMCQNTLRHQCCGRGLQCQHCFLEPSLTRSCSTSDSASWLRAWESRVIPLPTGRTLNGVQGSQLQLARLWLYGRHLERRLAYGHFSILLPLSLFKKCVVHIKLQ